MNLIKYDYLFIYFFLFRKDKSQSNESENGFNMNFTKESKKLLLDIIKQANELNKFGKY